MAKKKLPTEKPVDMAAALRYEHGKDRSPVVVAVGKGDLAAKIREIAEKENIPVYRDTVLAQALVRLGADVEIPPELYNAVAHILVHVARLDGKMGGKL